MKIPSVIHQTIADKSKLPAAIDESIRRLKALNPGWTYRIYDDGDIQNFIASNYGDETSSIFNSINPLYGAARADLFRYLLMLKEGGVYLDIKSSCSVPFETLIKEDDELLLSFWRNAPGDKFAGWGKHKGEGVENEFQNWHIICAPRHPMLQAVVDAVLDNLRNYSMLKQGVGKFGVLRTTGPLAYTKAILPLLAQHGHRLFDSDAAGLVYSVMPLDSKKKGHNSIFAKHYTKVKMPIVSSGPQTPLHYLRYKLLRLLGSMP